MNSDLYAVHLPRRFVVLCHEMPPGSPRPNHWDFMLESSEGLRTWALDREPAAGTPVPALALPLHRKAYLDYEGPVSGNRGVVQRWDAGQCRVVQNGVAGLELTLVGSRLVGRLALTPTDESQTPGRWTFAFSELTSPQC